jgi:hypothetical protein
MVAWRSSDDLTDSKGLLEHALASCGLGPCGNPGGSSESDPVMRDDITSLRIFQFAEETTTDLLG